MIISAKIDCANEEHGYTENGFITIAKALEKCKNVTVLTGAGISVQCGIPDFRSESGIWKRYDPKKCCTAKSFRDNAVEFWKFAEDMHTIPSKESDAHHCLYELEKMGIVKTIITHNIDGLHQFAGSSNVIEIHGNAQLCTCIDCGHVENANEFIWNKPIKPSKCIPKCPVCGSLMKLDVIMFGDELSQDIYKEAQKASIETDFLLVIGTSLKVAPSNLIPTTA